MLSLKNVKSNDEMNEIRNDNDQFNKYSRSIIPMEHKMIVFPCECKTSIIKNAFLDILSPMKIPFCKINNTNVQNTNNVFSLGKKNKTLKCENILNQNKGNTKNDKEQKDNPIRCLNNLKSFNSNYLDTYSINGRTYKNTYFKNKMDNKYFTLEIEQKYDIINKDKNPFDYYMYVAMKNQHRHYLPLKNIPYIEKQIMNYRDLNSVYTNKNIVIPEIQYKHNKKSKITKRDLIEYNCIKDNTNNFFNLNTEISNTLVKDNMISRIINENELKKNQSLSSIDGHKKSIERNISEKGNQIIYTSKQHFNIFDDISPSIKKNIKKKKKKNLGVCYFNLNNLSCQFLMTCDKT
ncbi:hypothetical protein PGSY75_0510700 [Plasmodium gaboni]|uniref:Uncharacterized protein n=1 Tax=Plasmodium gaboni TaxID=647221 RepID=A0A151LSY6_9APIC|nr:hypothetical protein PGSY75_0510700 [Plasmodium gaboni]KYO02303.1 hypothetical protein PGSY75_0510700 [Plasmodium gaboni]